MSDEKDKFKKDLKVKTEMARLQPGIKDFLSKMNGAAQESNGHDLPNRKKARELGFKSSSDIRNEMLKEQATQNAFEMKKEKINHDWIDLEMRKLSSNRLINWTKGIRWRYNLLGFTITLEPGFDLQKNCPTDTLRIFRWGKLKSAIKHGWEA